MSDAWIHGRTEAARRAGWLLLLTAAATVVAVAGRVSGRRPALEESLAAIGDSAGQLRARRGGAAAVRHHAGGGGVALLDGSCANGWARDRCRADGSGALTRCPGRARWCWRWWRIRGEGARWMLRRWRSWTACTASPARPGSAWQACVDRRQDVAGRRRCCGSSADRGADHGPRFTAFPARFGSASRNRHHAGESAGQAGSSRHSKRVERDSTPLSRLRRRRWTIASCDCVCGPWAWPERRLMASRRSDYIGPMRSSPTSTAARIEASKLRTSRSDLTPAAAGSSQRLSNSPGSASRS